MSDGLTERALRIGLVSVSDRASSGTYQDQGIPALREWLASALSSAFEIHDRLIPDERAQIEATLVDLCDNLHCDLILTTGGTGPARRDVTPEATLAIGTKEMPGFGEQMRQISLRFVPTAILSRQVAVIRETDTHAALIMNLPGQPKSIRETLEGLRDADGKVDAELFAAGKVLIGPRAQLVRDADVERLELDHAHRFEDLLVGEGHGATILGTRA